MSYSKLKRINHSIYNTSNQPKSFMLSEKSCGAVVYRETENGPVFLLLHYPAGHWGFPKGHQEESEDDLQTARREIHEETGITDIKFIEGFSQKVRYVYSRSEQPIDKVVVFYIAKTNQEQVTLSHEHQGFEWLPYLQTRERVTFEDEKKMFDAAITFLGFTK